VFFTRKLFREGNYTPRGGTELSPANLLGGIIETCHQGTYTPHGGIKNNPAKLLAGLDDGTVFLRRESNRKRNRTMRGVAGRRAISCSSYKKMPFPSKWLDVACYWNTVLRLIKRDVQGRELENDCRDPSLPGLYWSGEFHLPGWQLPFQ